ncbi:MAG TPA: SagB family peptide dehydrogenase, partial [Chloroflexota bacterium]
KSLRRFRVGSRLIGLMSRMNKWMTAEELDHDGNTVTPAELCRLVGLGVLEQSESGDREQDGGQAYHSLWNPYDLVVHRHGSLGGYRGAEALRSRGIAPPPVRKSRPDGPVTVLPAPRTDLNMPVGETLLKRRSIRTYGIRPVTLAELSTLLHHAARVVRIVRDSILGDQALRPFPGGGARSELEIYVVANDVACLNRGAHYFDPVAHDLVQLRSQEQHHERLIQSIHAATGGMLSRDPPVVLLITAVFARIMWKYQGIGLVTVYKDTGCLIQTLYLVATAMGLAPCAVGGGDEVTNSRWLGLDPIVEAQVGCVLIGPRRQKVSGEQ